MQVTYSMHVTCCVYVYTMVRVYVYTYYTCIRVYVYTCDTSVFLLTYASASLFRALNFVIALWQAAQVTTVVCPLSAPST